METTSKIHYFHSLQNSSSIFTSRKTTPSSSSSSSSLKSRRYSSIIIWNSSKNISGGQKLRAAIIGGGPAGSSAGEAISRGGIETYLIERSPSGAKPCGGAIHLCVFLDSFLRTRAQSYGTNIINALFTHLEVLDSPDSPYTVHYNSNGSKESISVDVVIGADGANSRMEKSIDAGNYSYTISFQERICLPDEKIRYYENLAEMYVGKDISPDFYEWVFPKCDHVAVGNGTVCSKQDIKLYQNGVRERVKEKTYGGKVIKMEAHPIPEHTRPHRLRGRVALVGDSASYVTKCSGESIYSLPKSGRMCGEAIVRSSLNGVRMIDEKDLRKEFLDILQKVFNGNNVARECLVEICGCDYVQLLLYLYKKLASGNPWEDVKMVVNTVGSLIRSNIIQEEMEHTVHLYLVFSMSCVLGITYPCVILV
ncbi:hypothetical protein MKW92_034942 [Papaver armeniacum]|nr:hypothetical protein MKW92_034942 [Papaver armeniacum]